MLEIIFWRWNKQSYSCINIYVLVWLSLPQFLLKTNFYFIHFINKFIQNKKRGMFSGHELAWDSIKFPSQRVPVSKVYIDCSINGLTERMMSQWLPNSIYYNYDSKNELLMKTFLLKLTIYKMTPPPPLQSPIYKLAVVCAQQRVQSVCLVSHCACAGEMIFWL